MTDAERLQLLRKQCPGCAREGIGSKPWSEFYVRERFDDGTVRQVQSLCKRHDNERCVNYQRRRREQLRSDAEAWAEFIQRKRENKRQQRRKVKLRERAAQFPSLAGSGGRVPSRQLAVALDRLIERERLERADTDQLNDTTSTVVIERVLPGFTQEAAQRALYAWRNGERERVAFDTADLVLTAAGWFWWEVWNEDTVRRYRWRFELCRMRRKKNHSTGKVYVNLVRTRIWYSGDLGPDYAELARIEALFTGSASTLEELAA